MMAAVFLFFKRPIGSISLRVSVNDDQNHSVHLEYLLGTVFTYRLYLFLWTLSSRVHGNKCNFRKLEEIQRVY